MKVAVCLSGQLRTFEKTYESIYNNIISTNSADVFIHSWDTGSHEYGIDKRRVYTNSLDMLDKVVDLYKPKKYLFEKPKDFSNMYTLHVTEPWINTIREITPDIDNAEKHIINQTCGMFYSIYKCNNLKNEYSDECNIHYDAVIRLRFDLNVDYPIHVKDLDLKKINYHAYSQPDGIINDWMNIGNTYVMNIYSSIFLNLEFLNNLNEYQRSASVTFRGCPKYLWGNEHFIREMMYMNNIGKQAINFHIRILYS